MTRPVPLEEVLRRTHRPTCTLLQPPRVTPAYDSRGRLVGWRFPEQPTPRCTCGAQRGVRDLCSVSQLT